MTQANQFAGAAPLVLAVTPLLAVLVALAQLAVG